MHETKEHFADLCSKLDTRLTQDYTQLMQQVEQDREQLATACRDLDAKLTETNELLSKRVDREFEQFTQVCAKLDKRLEFEVASAREHLLVEIDRANQKASDQNALLHKRIDAEHDTFAGISEKLSTTVAENHSRLDSQLTDAYESLDKKYGEKVVQHEERLGSEHRHFTDVCTRIQQTFNANLDELDGAFSEACTKLDAAGAQNQTTIDQHYAHFTQRVDELAEVVVAKSEATAELVEQNKVETVEAQTKLEVALKHNIGTLDSSMLEKSHQQDERVDDLSRMLTRVENSAQQDLSAQKHESSSQLADAKASLGRDLQALGKQIDFEVRDQISTLKNLVEQRVQKSVDTTSALLEGLNTRLKQEMEPKLADTETVARNAISQLETIETRLSVKQLESNAELEAELEAVRTEMEKLTNTVNGLVPALDVNTLLMSAASVPK